MLQCATMLNSNFTTEYKFPKEISKKRLYIFYLDLAKMIVWRSNAVLKLTHRKNTFMEIDVITVFLYLHHLEREYISQLTYRSQVG